MILRGPLPRVLYASEYSFRRFLSSQTSGRFSRPTDFELFTRRLNWLLRHGAVPPVMTIRPDGYVRLDDVRNLELFRRFSSQFDELLAQDESQSFKFIQEYDPQTGADATWIRARRGHTIKSIDWSVQRILSPEAVPTLVYSVDSDMWASIRRQGIRSQTTDGLIHLQSTNLVKNFDDPSHIFVLIDVVKMLAARMPLWRSTRGGRPAWLTTGDANSVLPPQVFFEAVKVEVDRQTVQARNLAEQEVPV
ncbi:hypothetical protein MSAN_00739600 [Mycena sanguinolenta]|uniref:Uncharacterized protein n=1 Tax=Mycena sanguinolenta TaxID=230812 RepID=A0A8H7DG74_9AGAR|nr:hypothetical protein MSAN_00739600 [Mycena sanguinolenta]